MHDLYENPLISRYASPEMSAIWGEARKFAIWRELWWILAETERELGLEITAAQVDELRRAIDAPLDWAAAEKYERQLRHDVMAHVHTLGDACPAARPIIHWGATSCYITDNADLIRIRDAARWLQRQLADVIVALGTFAARYARLPCLAFTHFQPAQPTTVGKRACLWNYDLICDLQQLDSLVDDLRARGAKGTTGTQASFLTLFAGDHARVKELDRRVSEKMGFPGSYPVTGQTYSRKVDARLLDVLAGIGQSAHKMATDWRLLAHRKELEEPFEKDQIGSSAMAYKRNPMRSERICGLARYLFSLQSSTVQTAANQWLERTLDDSANRRLTIPQAFLAADAILVLLRNVAANLVVYPQVIAANLQAELPFMATENLLMAAVAAGGDRQTLHEAIRRHSLAAAEQVKMHGKPNDLLARLATDPAFTSIDVQKALAAGDYVGRAPEQVDEFNAEWVEPIRLRYASQLMSAAAVRV